MKDSKSLLRLLPLLVALLFVLVAPRLMGPKGNTQSHKAPAPKPTAQDLLAPARDDLQMVDIKSRAELDEYYRQLTSEIAAGEGSKDPLVRTNRSRQLLLLGYTWERLAKSEDGALAEAVKAYSQLGRTPYAAIAHVRLAEVQTYQAQQAEAGGVAVAAAAYRKGALKAWEGAANLPPAAQTLVRTPALGFEASANGSPATWTTVPAREFALKHADGYYRSNWLYRFFDGLVRLSGGAQRNSSYILAIVLIAVLAKLITTPFSAAQFRSMREMQKVQPELKKLQEKYKGGDQKEFAKAQMQLFRDHNVNPMSSCLPMIVQTGILIYVYYGIRHFLFQFWGHGFFYLHNLANPDFMPGLPGFPGPLLILYAVSMFFTQKLISMPAATPEQAQQQRMMTIMMPVFLLFVMRGLPAAFILYWLLQNVLMTGHQWLIMRPHRAALAAANGAPARREKPASPPPPAAIQRLAQGTKAPGKKRKRR